MRDHHHSWQHERSAACPRLVQVDQHMEESAPRALGLSKAAAKQPLACPLLALGRLTGRTSESAPHTLECSKSMQTGTAVCPCLVQVDQHRVGQGERAVVHVL